MIIKDQSFLWTLGVCTVIYLCALTSNEQLTGGGERIHGNGLVPSCHGEEQEESHERGAHLTSAAPQLKGVKML